MDPLALLVEVDRATERLLATVERLDDAAVAEPSLLPGWTRGHVLTHLARNADSYVNLLTWARTGVPTPQYSSWQQREADIEAGAGRPAGAQVTDLRASCRRFADAAADLPVEAWAASVRTSGGASRPAAVLPWARWREVEVHAVDLDLGYRPRDWSPAFTQHLLREVVTTMAGRPDAPALILAPDELSHPLTVGGPGHATTVGGPEGATTVAGPAAALAAWLTGRDAGAELTVTPTGPLPALPDWI